MVKRVLLYLLAACGAANANVTLRPLSSYDIEFPNRRPLIIVPPQKAPTDEPKPEPQPSPSPTPSPQPSPTPKDKPKQKAAKPKASATSPKKSLYPVLVIGDLAVTKEMEARGYKRVQPLPADGPPRLSPKAPLHHKAVDSFLRMMDRNRPVPKDGGSFLDDLIYSIPAGLEEYVYYAAVMMGVRKWRTPPPPPPGWYFERQKDGSFVITNGKDCWPPKSGKASLESAKPYEN